MSFSSLEQHLPPGSLSYLKTWLSPYQVHIRITKKRSTKLGDYRKLADGSHQISINDYLPAELFFFVLTHELAHLIAFEEYLPMRISAHGAEWKQRFRVMLMESITVYSENLQSILIEFSRNPKANFMASPDLVKYFHVDEPGENRIFLETLEIGRQFTFKDETYLIEAKRKKNYLCRNLVNHKRYIFKALARVKATT